MCVLIRNCNVWPLDLEFSGQPTELNQGGCQNYYIFYVEVDLVELIKFS